ncbi:putative porin [Kordia sp.]|uniref:putative porin n=1 Tax=Kordia sp. TaxID=1965332 RepID=UPI0025BAF9AF|nr:putative porin [Kordia sp.]MCH2195118.1 putative porin [Kordia sp.]
MKHILFVIFICITVSAVQAQEGEFKPIPEKKQRLDQRGQEPVNRGNKGSEKDNTAKRKEYDINLYKVISHDRDTTIVDTTLTIQKDYKYNYLRRDDFELIPFSNLGQTYNSLGYSFDRAAAFPSIGMRAKHFNYDEVEDVKYFNVPTPTTELFFKTAMEQGQLLDAFITMNTSKRMNFSIAYKGMRSLGKYQNILSSTGNFRLTANYRTKNDRYGLRAHFYSQDVLNNENGGLTTEAVADFENGVEEFTDRSRLSVQFQDAQNILVGKRYFLEHDYKIVKQKDSIRDNNLRVGHTFNYETKYYIYDQANANVLFGNSFVSNSIRDRSQLRKLFNQASLSYSTKTFGDVKFKANHTKYDYFFDKILFPASGNVIPSSLEGDVIAIGGEWRHTIAGIQLKADLLANVSGELGGNYFTGRARYNFNDDLKAEASIVINSKAPNFNFLINQSDYIDYNWRNNFKNERTQSINFSLKSKKWGNADVSFASLDNYTYFSGLTAGAQVSPQQSQDAITYLKVKLGKEFRYGKFALNNTVMYQQVTQTGDVFNVPDLVTRNTLYYTDKWFKKALFIQTGVTFSYFTEYFGNAYSPLLGEFYSQNQQKIGGFPRFDVFINAKVRRTRIYFKLEHLNSSFTGYNFFAAPNQPYRDFVVRFGLVWNFFS